MFASTSDNYDQIPVRKTNKTKQGIQEAQIVNCYNSYSNIFFESF